MDGVAIVEYDLPTNSRRVLSCNDQYAEMAGMTREELMALPDIGKYLIGKDIDTSYERIQVSPEKSLAPRGTASWIRPDDRENYFEYTAAPIQIDDKLYIIAVHRDITERRRAEEELRLSREQLQSFFDCTRDGVNIVELDPETYTRRLVMCNDQYVEMSGRTREELMAAPDLDTFATPVASDVERKSIGEHWVSGKSARGVGAWVRPDGKENFYEWTATPIQIGEKVYIMGVDRDVTEQRRAAEELRLSKQQLQLFFDCCLDGVVVCVHETPDAPRRLVMCNDRYVEMSGRTREELLAAEDLNVFTQFRDHRGGKEGEHWKRIKGGQSTRGVSSWIRPDGKENFYEWTVAPIQMGEKLYLVGVDRDVTEQRRSEQALRESEERYRTLVESTDEAIFTISSKGELLFLNGRAVTTLGGDGEDFTGKVIRDLVPEETVDRLMEIITDVIDSETGKTGEQLIALSSEPRWWRLSAQPLRDDEGQIDSAMIIAADIHEQHRMQEELQVKQQQLQWLFEYATDGISICVRGPGGHGRRLVMCNDRYLEMTGRTREELMATEDLSTLTHSLLSPTEREEIRVKTSRGEPARGIASWIRPDGKENYFEWTMAPVWMGDKRFLFGVDRDITEQRRTQEELQRQKQQLQLFFDCTTEGVNIIELDPVAAKRRLVVCNDRFVEMSGRTREELMATADLNELTTLPYSKEDLQETHQNYIKGLPARGTASWNRPDGKENYIEWSAAPIWEGDKLYIVGADRDVTEQKRAQEELQLKQQQLQLFFDCTMDGVNIAEQDTVTDVRRLIACNDRYVEMSGRTREELMAAPNLQAFTTSDRIEAELKQLNEARKKGESTRGMSSWIRPDGKENYYEWTAAPIWMGDKLYIVGVDRDITERRRTEEALAEAHRKILQAGGTTRLDRAAVGGAAAQTTKHPRRG
jgi:PAS domain S-box-containing protein